MAPEFAKPLIVRLRCRPLADLLTPPGYNTGLGFQCFTVPPMTIKAKILCLVGAFALLAAAITGLGLATMADYNRIIDDYRHTSQNVFNGEKLNRQLTGAALDGRGVYMAKSDEEAVIAATQIDARADALTALINDWQKSLRPGELPKFAAVRKNVLEFARDGHVLAETTRNRGLQAANQYGNHAEFRSFREQMQTDVDSMVAEMEARQVQSQAALAQFEAKRQGHFLLIAATGILVLLGGSLWLAIGSIANPLGRIRRSMVRVSEGDYDAPIPDGRTGEIGELWGALDILKARAAEADRLSKQKLEDEHRLRELVLD